MTVRCSIVDLSGLPPAVGDHWAIRHLAMRDIHGSIDPHNHPRMALGAALAPPRVTVHPLGAGIIVLLALEVADAAS